MTASPKAKRRPTALDRALRLMDEVPFIDGHNDLPWVIREATGGRGDVAGYGLDRAHQETDTDIPRLRAGKVAVQFWAAFIPTNVPHPARTVLEQIDIVRQINERHPDVFLAATKPADVARAKRLGKIASFLAIEGGAGLENSLSPLRIWHAAGARLMTLCHNETLDWVDSATDRPRSGGLSGFGKAVVLELNRLGMLVDCAHVAPSVMHQVLEVSRAPIVFSHSNARGLNDHPRNVPDDVLDKLPANGGLVMATFIPSFLVPARRKWDQQFMTDGVLDFSAMETAIAAGNSPPPPAAISHVCDHIDYLAKRMGHDHVGIGSDFFGSAAHVPRGLEDVSRFPHLVAALIERGWTDRNLTKLLGGNFLRAFRKVEQTGKALRKTEPPRTGTVKDYASS